jgi:tRNA-specific 2-thiouridylase
MAASVLVAMSGGVDSSVAACLLSEQGYDVVGSHMRLVHSGGVDHGCCGPTAERDARDVAAIGGFPFEVADLSATFEDTVIADFLGEHAAGRTPNPCARCNEQIKFGAFLERANDSGVDFVATGHYVRTAIDGSGRWRLLRGADRSKDQSYMLHALGQRELSRSLFPVGAWPKAVTREHARRLGLQKRLHFMDGGDLNAMICGARGLVCVNSTSATLRKPRSAAMCRGVAPEESAACTFAPLLNRNSTTVLCPASTA